MQIITMALYRLSLALSKYTIRGRAQIGHEGEYGDLGVDCKQW